MPLEPGTQLAARYDLLALLGEGGSARVFRAHDQLLGREVAVKVQHAHVPDSDRERFLREVRTLARLTHPGVIPVLDLGTDPEAGRPFFTMPLMTGGPVTALGPLEDAPLPLARFLTAAAAASRALHFIHARGITHRDLTPGNVLLDDAWMPRIMDFGLVALTEQTRHLTRSGVTLGTPAYMAPEQARGVGVGPLSDLYALGAVLYRVACGSPPFVGDSDQSVLYQHVYEAAPDPRDLNPAVPDAVARVLLSLLAKRPEDRPPSGEALAHLWALARRDVWTSHARGQYRGGRTRSGEHPDGPAQVATLREAWSVPLPGEVTWPAAVMGDGHLYALDARTGDLKWAYRTGGPVAASPLVWAGAALVSDENGWLHALDARSGHGLWKVEVGTMHGTPALIPTAPGHATLVVATWEGEVHALTLHAHTGRVSVDPDPIQWTYDLEDEVWASPALTLSGAPGGTAILAGWGGEVRALGLKDGEDLWTHRMQGRVTASPVISAGLVFLASEDGELCALDVRSGAVRWTHQESTGVQATPLAADGTLYVAFMNGTLRAYRARTT